MHDPRRHGRPEGPRYPYRQILDRARHPSGWRSSLVEAAPVAGSFIGEVIVAAGIFLIIAILVFRFG
jgi:hypothetical protein